MKKKTTTVRATPKKLSVSASTPKSNLYDVDFYKWTKTQVNLLKKKDIEHIDLENLIEEIETLGRSEKDALRSHISNLFSHLLKVDYQTSKKTKSWDNTIKESLARIKYYIEDNPSFKRLLPQLAGRAYDLARYQASKETKLDVDTFPEECPEAYIEYLKFAKK